MSRRPGLGDNYIKTHARWHIDGLRPYTQVNGQFGSLPRFYRDKIFKDKDGEWKINPDDLIGDHSERADYLNEIERLKKFHDDPYAYYNESRRAAHDSIKHKSNQLNKF